PTAWAAGLPATSAAPPARRGRAWIAALIAALVLLSGGIGIGWVLTKGGTSTPSTGTEAPLKTVPPAGSSKGQSTRELSQQAIANIVDPAVVDVNTIIDGFNTGSTGRAAGTEGRGHRERPWEGRNSDRHQRVDHGAEPHDHRSGRERQRRAAEQPDPVQRAHQPRGLGRAAGERVRASRRHHHGRREGRAL